MHPGRFRRFLSLPPPWKLPSTLSAYSPPRSACTATTWTGSVSILSGAHRVLLPCRRELLDERGASEIRLMAGGVIPQEDLPVLEASGVCRLFLFSTPIQEIVDSLTHETPPARDPAHSSNR